MHAIYLTDLALRYFPRSSARSAVTQLRRWIVLNEELQKKTGGTSLQEGAAHAYAASARGDMSLPGRTLN